MSPPQASAARPTASALGAAKKDTRLACVAVCRGVAPQIIATGYARARSKGTESLLNRRVRDLSAQREQSGLADMFERSENLSGKPTPWLADGGSA